RAPCTTATTRTTSSPTSPTSRCCARRCRSATPWACADSIHNRASAATTRCRPCADAKHRGKGERDHGAGPAREPDELRLLLPVFHVVPLDHRRAAALLHLRE